MDASTLSHDEEAHRRHRLVGLGYGLTYGLAYSLTAWGIDAWVLARARAELAGAKLAVGLPLLLLIGAAAGAVGSTRAGAWVGVWIGAGTLTGAVVGVMPYAGLSLATWIVEPRLWGETTYPMEHAGAARLAFTVVLTACAGAAAHYFISSRWTTALRCTQRERGIPLRC